MLVRYFEDLAAPREAVEAALTRGSREWLSGLFADAGSRGDRLMVEVGFGNAARVHRKVLVHIGDPQRLDSKTLLPISWQPVSGQGLLPAMEGDIEIAAIGGNRTQLAMMMRYTPPLGIAGKVADRALLHRVAEATIRDFLVGVGRRIEESLASDRSDALGT